MTRFGKRVRRLLEVAGLSQAESASLLDVPRSTLEDWIAQKPRRAEPHILMQRGALEILKSLMAHLRPIMWTEQMQATLGQRADSALAQEWGISRSAVRLERDRLEIAPVTKAWPQEWIGLLGTATDREVAAHIGRSIPAVTAKRIALCIPSFTESTAKWTAETLGMLGMTVDRDVATRVGISVSGVAQKRRKLGIPVCKKKRQ